MRHLHTGSMITLAIALSAISAPALADQASTKEPAGDDIIVTARRSEERLQDVPISITVFNQAQLAQRNITSPVELATYTPSLTTNQRFGPEKSSFVIRGFTQEAGTAPSVGVYFADVVAPRAMGGTTGGNGATPGTLFDLQNVQVLKGPQGTLFGRNTTGGAVLLVPQKPTDKLEGFVEGSAGNYGMWRGQAVINIPLSDTFRVRAGIDRMSRDGYLRNHSGIGPDAYNDTNYFAARLSVVADLTPDLENYTIATYNHSFAKGFSPRITLCDPVNRSGARLLLAQPACDQIARQTARGDTLLDVENSNPDPYIRIQQWQVINTTTWHASDSLTVKNIASYGEYRERASFSLAGDNFKSNFAGLPVPLPSGVPFQYILLNPAGPEDNASQSTFTEELQLQGRTGDGRLNWQAGAYLEVSNPLGFSSGYTGILLNCANAANLACTNPLGAGSISYSSTKTWFNNKGLYAQATYKPTARLSLTAGIRYTSDRMTGLNESERITLSPAGAITGRFCADSLRFQTAAGAPLPVTAKSQCDFTAVASSKRPTWLIDIDYKPNDDVMLYAKWARGYRQGGVVMSNIGLEGWGPEKVDTYEIGAKTAFHGATSGYFNIAAFYNDFRDQQITAILIAKPTSGLAGGSAIVNAGKSRIWGIEADTSVTFLEHFRIDAGYTYLNTKLLRIALPTLDANSPFQSITATATPGSELSFSPKNRFTLSGTYTLPLPRSIGQVSLGATYVHTDGQNATSAAASPLYRLPATDLVNLNLDWKGVAGTPIDLSLFATNVTNQIYTVGVGSQYTSGGFENVLVAPPRMYGMRLRYSFGS
ncbi:MAG: TonB-dependent receptor [Sphingomonadales bacterium]|nr:TonB-dependent receptor [Sphingomonadales bacterium]